MTVEAETGTAAKPDQQSRHDALSMRFPSMDPEVGPTDGNLEDNNGHVDDYNGRAGKAVATITLPELSFRGEGGVRTHSKPSRGTAPQKTSPVATPPRTVITSGIETAFTTLKGRRLLST